MRLILFLLLSTLSIFSSAQIKKDSVLIFLQDESKDTTLRLAALRQYCSNDFLFTNPKKSIQFAKMGIELAEGIQSKSDLAFGWYCLGVTHNYLGETQEAILFQKQSIEISEEIKDTTMLTKSLNNLGNIYLNRSDFSNAINCYRDCQKLLEEKGNERGVAICKNNIGLVFYDLKDYKKSLDYLTAALAIYKKLGSEGSQANTLINIGTVYRIKEEYDQALEYYETGLDLKKKNNIKHGLGTCYSNIGLIYRAKGEEEKALDYFKLSIALHREMNYKKGIARNLIHLGDWYFPNQLDSTIFYASSALTLAEHSKYTAEITDAAELLFKSYDQQENYKEAMKMQTKFRNLRDSMHSAKSQRAIFKSEYKLDEDENEESFEEKLLSQQNWNKNLLVFFLGAAVLTILALGFFIKKRKNKDLKEKEKLLQQIEELKKNLSVQSVATSRNNKKTFSLDKDKIEKAIDNRLGESSWKILNLIFNNPSISNKEIAEQVSLSVEGVSSSLRRMYQAFEIDSSSNKKITLIMKATRLSFED